MSEEYITCSITLYKNCAILRDKNFKVDGIADYLQTLNQKTYSTSQMIKHALRTTYKIVLNQQDIDLSKDNYNYAKFQNIHDDGDNTQTDLRGVYYFIINKKWTSKNCVELELEMDVINTLDGHYNLSSKTVIKRQHKDRWEETGEGGDEGYKPVIDLYSEGIYPVLFKQKENTLYHCVEPADKLDYGRWYLIYKADEVTSKPVDIYLCTDEEIVVSSYQKFNGSIDPSIYPSNYGVGIYGNDTIDGRNNIGASISFTYEGNNYTWTISTTDGVILFQRNAIIYGKLDEARPETAPNLALRVINIVYLPKGQTFESLYLQNVNSAWVNVWFNIQNPRVHPDEADYKLITEADFSASTFSYLDDILKGQSSDLVINAISDINRAEPLILKVICLPYCPTNLQLGLSSEEYSVGDLGEWEIAQNVFTGINLYKYRYRDLAKHLLSTIRLLSEDGSYDSPYDKFEWRGLVDLGESINKSADYEPKLWHSDFYQQKLVYDNFYYIFRGEFLEPRQASDLYINMITSTSMSSKFIFEIPYAFENMKTDTNDYSGIIAVVRNNELPIYNEAYLNYIREGYNFDIKTRNRQLATSIVTTSIQAVGSVAGIVGGVLASGVTAGASAVAGISLAFSTLGSIAKTISSTAQNDQNIAEKLKQAEMQGANISGADDIDLLSYYTGNNKLKLIEYNMSSKMQKAMFDLFYYCGYIANIQDIPDTTSRVWFNFVQAEVVYEPSTENIPNEYYEKLSEKYSEGITFLHKQGYIGNWLWNFEQTKENWETSLMSLNIVEQSITIVEKNKEYVINKDLRAVLTNGKITGNPFILRVRQANGLVLEKYDNLDAFNVLGIAQTLGFHKDSEVIKSLTFREYAFAPYYLTIEFSGNIPTPTTSQSHALMSLLGYIEK